MILFPIEESEFHIDKGSILLARVIYLEYRSF